MIHIHTLVCPYADAKMMMIHIHATLGYMPYYSFCYMPCHTLHALSLSLVITIITILNK